MTADLAGSHPAGTTAPTGGSAPAALFTAALGFFVITLDALVVNVALPDILGDLGGGIAGSQWVLDGYTLMFAAFLLSAGALSDRIGARRAFGLGLAVFVVASAACGLATDLGLLIGARLVQGVGAAMMMPSSLALIREAYSDPVRRARAIAVWGIGGAVAMAAGPVAGGALNLVNWRLIFIINLPVGAVAFALLARAARSPRRPAPFDRLGQIAVVPAMAAITYAVIEAGTAGITAPQVLAAIVVAVIALTVFLLAQARGKHPMMPLSLFRSRAVRISSGTGFAFMMGFYGLVFVYSLYLQQQHGLSSLATGLVFLPMMVLSGVISPLSVRIAERVGPRVPIIVGMVLMTVGSAALATLPDSAPAWVVALVMIPAGLTGPLVIPSTTAQLLENVPADRAGLAGGVFNTSRQLGAALAVAVFGALLADSATFIDGLRVSMVIAAVVAGVSAVANVRLRPTGVAPAPAER